MRQMNAMSRPLASAPAADWHLGPNVPQSRHPWLQHLGLWWMRRTGWQFEGQMPDLPKFVVIVAPHTSNWDFFIGLAAKWALGFGTSWWGKASLFIPPLGWFMRAIGGIPIDRHNKANVVEHTIAAFRARSQFVVSLAPEGTRRQVTAWRSGFWHVAQGAGVPICCVAFDWGRRVVRLGPTTEAHETNATEGIARIRALYAGVQGRHPQS
ncbi:acyltransferase [Gemmatimonas aurantiaca T-27]|uniref:Acyltransferase n=3 Tax=Gemmatimonas aurantiaca TaxID=173480 RepID=C1AAJ8_GEMAT|nr:acyltransferase [Gemmatimonas aurantiaca T-27]